MSEDTDIKLWSPVQFQAPLLIRVKEKQPQYRLGQALRLQKVEVFKIFRQSIQKGGKAVSITRLPPLPPRR
jgi:hypothetical protein